MLGAVLLARRPHLHRISQYLSDVSANAHECVCKSLIAARICCFAAAISSCLKIATAKIKIAIAKSFGKVTDKNAKKKCVFVRRFIFGFGLCSQDGVVNPDLKLKDHAHGELCRPEHETLAGLMRPRLTSEAKAANKLSGHEWR